MTIQSATIERCPHDGDHPYTIVSNELIRDNSITPNCRWLLIYLLSNDKGWKINATQLVNYLKPHMGRVKVYKLIKEAIEAGYMSKEDVKTKNLKNGVRYYVSEKPKFKKFLRRSNFGHAENKHSKKEQERKERTTTPTPSKPKKSRSDPPPRDSSSSSLDPSLEKELDALELNADTKERVAKYPADKIRAALQVMRESKYDDAASFLVAALKNDYKVKTKKPDSKSLVSKRFKEAFKLEVKYSNREMFINVYPTCITFERKRKLVTIYYDDPQYDEKVKHVLDEVE